MGAISEIFNEYARMRSNGLDSQATLGALRPYIEPLSYPEKQELAHHLKAWEAGSREAFHPPESPNAQTQPQKPKVIKPLAQASKSSSDMKQDTKGTWIECPSCHKKNRSTEVFCYSCGHLLDTTASSYDTRLFADADESQFSGAYFGPDSVLFIEMRDLKQSFEFRPQLREHELVIGRSTDQSVMTPDIDLGPYQADALGVSRLHLSLKYHETDDAIIIHDLGSVNGSYINGQRLHPSEVRVLRNGDELRLGRFVLRAYFSHPGQEIR